MPSLEVWPRVRDIGRALGFDHGSIRSLLIQRSGEWAPPSLAACVTAENYFGFFKRAVS